MTRKFPWLAAGLFLLPLPGLRAAPAPEVFVNNNCTACHGPDLTGGMALSLRPLRPELAKDPKALRKIIVEGVMDKGMPPNASLSPADLDAIVAWLRTAAKP